jgi:hypothetical protein
VHNGREALVKVLFAIGAAAAVLALPGSAFAAPPSLVSVADQQRQPQVTFSAPRAGAVTVYLATKPDRDTDGNFIQQNLREVAILTPADIQAGTWTDSKRVSPGTYYVMLHAQANYDACANGSGIDPACADGFSNILTLSIAKPAVRYAVKVKADLRNKVATLMVTATPMGEKTPYRVCYRTVSRVQRCTAGVLQGYDWDQSVQNAVFVGTSNLPAVTTFTWYVRGQKVAAKRVRVH